MKNEFRHFYDVRTGEEEHEAMVRSCFFDSNILCKVIVFDHNFDTNKIILSDISKFTDSEIGILLCFEL